VQWPIGWGKCRAMSDMPRTGTRVADHNVVATFDNPDQARAALTHLERHGVDAADIELFGPGADKAHQPITNDEQRAVDLKIVSFLGRRIGPAMVGGAIVLGVLAAVVGRLAFHSTMGMVLAGVGGAIVGAWLGLLYGGYTGLAVDEDWADTFAAEGETSVAVHSADEREIEAAIEALKAASAKRLAVYGRDGQLRDVA
jgi:hypothetical protein